MVPPPPSAAAAAQAAPPSPVSPLPMVNVLMIGTGEYTTGYVGTSGGGDNDNNNDGASKSDKSAGVVAITIFDLHRRGHVVQKMGMCGVNGTKFPKIRQHLQKYIGNVYQDMNDSIQCLETYPNDDVIDSMAYQTTIQNHYKAGDVAIIFTPDHTHYTIAMECIQHGMHVLVTKPIVQTLQQHYQLIEAAKQYNVLVAIEVHKRYDPFYQDAHDRIRSNQNQNFGPFQYMYAYMSQPKHQLDTFAAWAGTSSDISYYLNSHHIDWCEWTLRGYARPIRVTATSSNGIAYQKGIQTEDSITLTVQWENKTTTNTNNKNTIGCAIYTASWVAPQSDVHSQQRFFYMGTNGEINIDQAHRGYSISMDTNGYKSYNPLFMKYLPNEQGYFDGKNCYGVRSIESFIVACQQINAGNKKPLQYNTESNIATIQTTLQTTAILEAGRRSLNHDSQPMDIIYQQEEKEVVEKEENQDSSSWFEPIDIRPHVFM